MFTPIECERVAGRGRQEFPNKNTTEGNDHAEEEENG